jgi:hypothetical protein
LTKSNKIIISSSSIIIGFLLNGLAFTTKIGHPISTICLLIGLGMFFFGIIFLIINLNSK